MDIAKERERAQQLIHTKENAESVSRAKSEFMANITSELRPTLNGILAMIQPLSESSELGSKDREKVTELVGSREALSEIVNKTPRFLAALLLFL